MAQNSGQSAASGAMHRQARAGAARGAPAGLAQRRCRRPDGLAADFLEPHPGDAALDIGRPAGRGSSGGDDGVPGGLAGVRAGVRARFADGGGGRGQQSERGLKPGVGVGVQEHAGWGRPHTTPAAQSGGNGEASANRRRAGARACLGTRLIARIGASRTSIRRPGRGGGGGRCWRKERRQVAESLRRVGVSEGWEQVKWRARARGTRPSQRNSQRRDRTLRV